MSHGTHQERQSWRAALNALVYDIITYAYNDTCPCMVTRNHAANAMGFVAALNFTQANVAVR